MTAAHTGQSRGIGCEIIAALLKRPRTISEILEMVDVSEMVVRYWLHDLQHSGLVRVSAYVERGVNRETGRHSTGRRRAVYAWQLQPFALPDAERGATEPDARAHVLPAAA